MKKFSSTARGNLRRTYRTKRIAYIFSAGAALVILLMLLPRAFAFVSSVVLTPLVAVETWLMESNAVIPAYIRDRSYLVGRVEELEEQLSHMENTNSAEERLRRENKELRAILGDENEPRIGASVIGRPTALPYDVLVLDKGSNDGVVVNAPVYAGLDQVIGSVAETFANTSVVTLATTPGLSSTVYIYGPDIYTTAEGMGGGMLRVNVPQGIDLRVGDTVVLPAFTSGAYGSITVVESVPTKPEQYGYVSTDIPLSSLRFVSVGRQPLESVSFDEARSIIDRVRFDILSVPVPDDVLIDSETATTATTTDGAEVAGENLDNL